MSTTHQRRKADREWISLGKGEEGFWYAIGLEPAKHGTWDGYNNWYCRCVPCTIANSVKVNGYLQKKSRSRPMIKVEHERGSNVSHRPHSPNNPFAQDI